MDKAQLHSDLTKQVIEIIFSALNLKHINKAEVNLQTPLTKGGLELDSVDILELIVNFEQAFGIKLDESVSYSQYFQNVGTIVEFIETQKNGSV